MPTYTDHHKIVWYDTRQRCCTTLVTNAEKAKLVKIRKRKRANRKQGNI